MKSTAPVTVEVTAAEQLEWAGRINERTAGRARNEITRLATEAITRIRRRAEDMERALERFDAGPDAEFPLAPMSFAGEFAGEVGNLNVSNLNIDAIYRAAREAMEAEAALRLLALVEAAKAEAAPSAPTAPAPAEVVASFKALTHAAVPHGERAGGGYLVTCTCGAWSATRMTGSASLAAYRKHALNVQEAAKLLEA